MTKSGFIVGGVIGAAAVILIFAFVLMPAQQTLTPDLIISNGHDVTKFGDETILSTKKSFTLVELFEKSESGVVRIDVDKINSSRETGSLGSGFVFDDLGHIITNAHVVESASSVTITFLDGSQYNAQIIGLDKFTDIAVIKVEEKPRYLHPLQMGDSSTLKVGEQVAAIGNPFGLSGSMTSGIVSQIGRLLPSQDTGFSIPNVIQTDAAINPGNSGGPLLNMAGKVMGINTAIQSGTGQSAGIGFAVPSNTILKVVPVLIEKGKYSHPWIGISGKDIDPELAKVRDLDQSKGFLIVTVVDDGPASKAGLIGSEKTILVEGVNYPIGGDVILAVDGTDVRKIDDILIHLQRAKSIGDEMVLEILRDNRTTTITIILQERPNVN